MGPPCRKVCADIVPIRLFISLIQFPRADMRSHAQVGSVLLVRLIFFHDTRSPLSNHVIQMFVGAGVSLLLRAGVTEAAIEQVISVVDGIVSAGAVVRPVAENAVLADPGIQAGARERLAQIGLDAADKQGDVPPLQVPVERLEQVQESGVRVPRPLENQDDHADLAPRRLLDCGKVLFQFRLRPKEQFALQTEDEQPIAGRVSGQLLADALLRVT